MGTIVILIRRKEPRPSSVHGHLGGSGHRHGVSKIRRNTDRGTESGGSSGSSTREYAAERGRDRADSEVVRDASEMVVHSYSKQEKQRSGGGGGHHHHHHRHKHRSGRDSTHDGEKSSAHHRSRY